MSVSLSEAQKTDINNISHSMTLMEGVFRELYNKGGSVDAFKIANKLQAGNFVASGYSVYSAFDQADGAVNKAGAASLEIAKILASTKIGATTSAYTGPFIGTAVGVGSYIIMDALQVASIEQAQQILAGNVVSNEWRVSDNEASINVTYGTETQSYFYLDIDKETGNYNFYDNSGYYFNSTENQISAGNADSNFVINTDTNQIWVHTDEGDLFGDITSPDINPEILVRLTAIQNGANSTLNAKFSQAGLGGVLDADDFVSTLQINNGDIFVSSNLAASVVLDDLHYTYTNDGYFTLKTDSINAFYQGEIQVVLFRDPVTDEVFNLQKYDNGQYSLAYSGSPDEVQYFALKHDLPSEFRDALDRMSAGMQDSLSPEQLQALYDAHPDFQNHESYNMFLAQAFGDQGLNWIPPIPGHKPDVPVGTENTDTFTTTEHTTSVTINGETLYFAAMVGIDEYTNADLFGYVKGIHDNGIDELPADSRLSALGVLLERYESDAASLAGDDLAFVSEGNAQILVELSTGTKWGAVTTVTGQGFDHQISEVIGQGSINDVVTITSLDQDQDLGIWGDHIELYYPEDFLAQKAGGFFGNLIGQKLADGNIYQEVLYSSLFSTAGENFGTFVDLLGQGTITKDAAYAAINGVDTAATQEELLSFTDGLLNNLSGKISSVIGSLIVDEVVEVLDIGGIGGEVVSQIGNAYTVQLINETFDVVFAGLSDNPIVFDGDFSIDINISNLLAAYAGNRLAGEVIDAENEVAGVLGSLGSAFGTAIGGAQLLTSTALGQLFASGGVLAGPIGIALGAFVGTVAGTFLGNAFGGGQDEPWAGARGGYDPDTQLYKIGSWGTDDGGDASIARSMLQQVINGVNSVLEITQGKIRSGAKAPGIEIGYDGDEYFVAIEGQYKVFSTAVDAIYHASYKLMSEFDLVGGHAVIMRAWHNTDADNLFELKEDLEVAEAFQNYLANPTAILALMMNEPESELAQSWAAILQRAAELELHLPHEKDLDGGWSEILLAQGADPSLIPDIQGDNIVLTDPVTGEETVVHHVIGPGYEIVRIEGTDGNDIIEVIVDGPSISYVNAGAGDDVIEGSEQDDILVGGAGDDTINGNGGNDWLHGGTGDDNLDGGAGEDLIVGGMQNDYLIGGDDNDHIYGNHGDDILMGMAGQDFLYGGQGNDVLHGDNDNGVQDFLYGEEGDDVFHLNYNELAYGGAGNDTFLFSHAAKNNNIYISRGDGHDVIEGDPTYHNALIFDETIGGNELFYQRIGVDLKITVLGENQSVTVTDYFSGSRSISIMNHGGWYRAEVNGSGREAITNMVNADANIAGHLTTEYGVLSDGYLAQRGDAWQQNFVHKDPSHVRSYITHDEHVSEQLYVHWNNWLAYGGAGNDEIINLEPTAYNHNRFYGDSGNDKIYGGHGNDTLVGGLGNDLLRGDLHDDRLYGGHGNDNLLGGDQNDELHGGAGNDTLKGQQHNDVMYGGDGDDYIQDYHDDNELYGGQGNDTITTYAEGFAGNNKIHGNEGHDIITGGYGDDWISADEGDDTVIDMGGINWIYLGEGNDTVNVRGGSNNVYGDAGDDVFTMNFVSSDLAQYFSGGEGNDILKIYMNAVDYTTAIEADIKAAYDFITFSEKYNQNSLTLNNINVYLAGVETFEFYLDDVLQTNINEYIGDQNNNTVTASTYNDVIKTGAGDDYITASAGDDYIEAGTGSDTIYGQEGNDTIYAGGWNDTIFGDGGWNSTYGGDDVIYAEAGNDTVHGRAGNDTIYGGDGHDTLNGHEGEDVIYGGAGVDIILGDGGWNAPYAYDDTLHGGAGNDDINGGGGNDTIFGDEGNDLLKGANGDDTIDGGIGIDRLEGGNGDDTLHGGEGNDLLFGDNDNDILYGDAGFDKLNGGAGDDVLYASSGWDYLIGGTGDDVFVFSSLDDHNQGNGNQYNRVRDFNDIDDSIDISSVLDTIYDPLADVLSDFVQVVDNGAHTYIRVDGDGAGTDLAMNTIAMIEGYTGHGKDLETMINEGKLIV